SSSRTENNESAEHTARKGVRLPRVMFGREGVGEYHPEVVRDAIVVHHQYGDHCEEVDNHHKGDHTSSPFADAFDPTEDHNACDHGQYNSGVQVRIHDKGRTYGHRSRHYTCGFQYDIADCLCKLVGLKDGQSAKEAEETEHGSEGPPFPAQPFRYDVHRSALDLTVRVFPAVHAGQGARVEIGGHANDGADPHPEYGSGTADGDCNGHACNVTHAHRGGKRRGYRLIGRQLPWPRRTVLSTQYADGMKKIAVGDKPRIDQEKQPTAHQKKEQRKSPQPIGEINYTLFYQVLSIRWPTLCQ